VAEARLNLFQKIRIARLVNRAYAELEKERNMNPTKPGWKTSEFWMTTATTGLTLLGATQGFIPADYATVAVAALTAVYTICRTLNKNAAIKPQMDTDPVCPTK